MDSELIFLAENNNRELYLFTVLVDGKFIRRFKGLEFVDLPNGDTMQKNQDWFFETEPEGLAWINETR